MKWFLFHHSQRKSNLILILQQQAFVVLSFFYLLKFSMIADIYASKVLIMTSISAEISTM